MSPYIVAPADVARCWVGVHLTGEVNIVSFTDVIQLEGISNSDGNPGPIYYSGENNKINYNLQTYTQTGWAETAWSRLQEGR